MFTGVCAPCGACCSFHVRLYLFSCVFVACERTRAENLYDWLMMDAHWSPTKLNIAFVLRCLATSSKTKSVCAFFCGSSES